MILAITTGLHTGGRPTTAPQTIVHSWSSYLLVVGFLFTLKNNIAILYERNELRVNENAYGVIKSLMESPIWI
jgi:hypothetical protein